MEIIIIISIISIGLISIINLLSRGTSYVQKSRQKVIALNLAREGMEEVYQIRDTNRKRWSGKRDACWLKIDPLVDPEHDGCSNDAWMLSGSYALLNATASGQQYFTLTGASSLDVTNGIDTTDLKYSLCLLSGRWSACPGQSALTPEGRYFREIRIYGLYKKDSAAEQLFECPSGSVVDPSSGPCDSSTPKELVFCSTVAYVGEGV